MKTSWNSRKVILVDGVTYQTCVGPCGRTLPINRFHRAPGKKLGRLPRCPECRKLFGMKHTLISLLLLGCSGGVDIPECTSWPVDTCGAQVCVGGACLSPCEVSEECLPEEWCAPLVGGGRACTVEGASRE